jgi:hypothetical protein
MVGGDAVGRFIGGCLVREAAGTDFLEDGR